MGVEFFKWGAARIVAANGKRELPALLQVDSWAWPAFGRAASLHGPV